MAALIPNGTLLSPPEDEESRNKILVPPATDQPGTPDGIISEAQRALELVENLTKPQAETSESPDQPKIKTAAVSDSEAPKTTVSTENSGNKEPTPEVQVADPIDWKSRILGLPLLVSVGEFEFEDFKNRWGEEGRYHVIELLMGSDRTLEEKRKEETQRERKSAELGIRQDPKTKSSTGERWIQRIRIHSPFVLGVLKDAMNPPDWTCDQPRVFFRPFKGLIHYHGYVKERLEELEQRCQDMQGLEAENDKPATEETEEEATKSQATQTANTNEVKDINKSRENTTRMDLEHLRCYVEFMDTRIMPLENMFNGTDRRMVYWEELWHLFKIGEVLYAPTNTPFKETGGLRAAKGRYQNAFKLYFKGTSVIDDSYPDDLNIQDRTMVLWCYYLEYNGVSYGPVKQRIVIQAFGGKKDIRDLPAYPIRFAPNVEKIQEDLAQQGKRFRSFTKEKHCACEGWNITGPPLGVLEKEDSETPEHVEGDVIIDFQETLRRQPSWKPEFEAPNEETTDDWKHGMDRMMINHWPSTPEPDKAREPLFSIQEFTQRDDDSEEKGKLAGMSRDALLQAYKEGDVTTLDGLDEEINNLLLPRRFFVYVLRQRRFAMVDIYSLQGIPPQSTIFDDLQIDMNHKLIVQSLVAAHFEKQKVQRHRPVLGPVDQDLVRGKGSGLFILLHGVPGVGKTATAEAVAQANNKPLFTITCGDLGLTPEAVDSKLNEVFRLAHLWDCVLLLDEADVFLARRDTHNLQRNALVSGILDEAFKSRIHISLYYEPLSRHQTVEIFRVNIRRLRGIEDEKQRQLEGTELEQPRLRIMAKSIIDYAQSYYDEHEDTPHLRWNGRQIRNAFQIASSLAHYNMNKASLSTDNLSAGQVASPVLDERQFENVAVAIEQFGNYMDYTKAMTDADQARLETIRADHMRNEDLTPRRRDHPRRKEQARDQYRSTSEFRDGPSRERTTENTRGEERRRARDQVSSRTTRHRESGMGRQSDAPTRSPRPRAQAASQGRSSISGRVPGLSQRQEQRPRYDDDLYEEEDEFSDERDVKRSDQRSRNRADVGHKEEDYDDLDELTDGGARRDVAQADELDYDD
ncbi:hypothetical protein ACHAO9_007712 [Fusarium lateritium]